MIHIIRHNWHDTSILSRKAQVLAGELSWTMGDQPDPGAAINYSFPYLDGRDQLKGIPYAAYFTHREDVIPGKVAIWQERARGALLRITSAEQYYQDLQQYGPTVKITPPLDREKFSPGGRSQPGAKKVGVAGYVYRGGRKGEGLLAEAVKQTGHLFEFKAIGKGWPIPTKNIPYEQLQEFYREIDIYLCTATIEGIPYPPLEALACGAKIVIPRGVGLLDEIPDLPGIERYQAGDAGDMIAAINRAAAAGADIEQLRSATEKYTANTWVEGHAEAFSELINVIKKTGPGNKAGRKQDQGIYTVAYGSAARACARRLIKSIREHMPETPVAVAGDQEIPEADHNIKYTGEIDNGARRAKLAAWDLALQEWDRVIYLDADTELTEPVHHLFYCLKAGWDMVFVKDVNSRATVEYLYRKRAPEDYERTLGLVGSEQEIALAGGVWGFNRAAPSAKRYLAAWQSEWGEGQYRDQPAMLRAYYKTKIRAIILGSEWNSFTKLRHENRAEIIRHYSGGTARNHPAALEAPEVIVTNTGKKPIERAGLLFMPNSPVLVKQEGPGFKEIRACSLLRIEQNQDQEGRKQMSQRTDITVVNTSREEIWRGGYVFRPRSERTVNVTEAGRAEIKACAALNIFEPGVICPHPGCGFVAKNESGLRFHKRKHDKEAAPPEVKEEATVDG